MPMWGRSDCAERGCVMGVAPTKTELIDLFCRSFWTFLSSFLGVLTAAGSGIVDVSARNVAIISAFGAVATLVKAYASNKLGTGTATTKEEPSIGLKPVASESATPAT